MPRDDKRQGRLIVIEGPDGSGKSTLAGGLAEALTRLGIPASVYAFPGNEPGTLGSLTYRIHHQADAVLGQRPSAAALQALHLASHLDAIERVIVPRLLDGHWVVLDRYWWSMSVYARLSGVRRAIIEALVEVERASWGAIVPSAVIFLDREEPIREGEAGAHWQTLAGLYRELAEAEGARVRVIVERRLEEPLRMAELCAEQVLSGARPEQQARAAAQIGLPLSQDDVKAAPVVNPGRFKTLATTSLFSRYWEFAAERQRIFFRRLEGLPPPWTSDPVLGGHRFTNAYRASDRVSQYLIRQVQYEGSQEPEEIFLRTILFKLFNRIETWELIRNAVGDVSTDSFDVKRLDVHLTKAMQRGQRVYAGAYIMPAVPGHGGLPKHTGHLHLVSRMLSDGLPRRIAGCPSLREVFGLLRECPSLGDFLAFQYAIDLNYSTLIDFEEADFVVAGPGARAGIDKCFPRRADVSYEDVIRLVTDNQEVEIERHGVDFKTLWGRPLQPVDCQNLFCEVDKYSRVTNPELTPPGGRTRIKQRFHASSNVLRPWYPPKWGLNEKIGSPNLNL